MEQEPRKRISSKPREFERGEEQKAEKLYYLLGDQELYYAAYRVGGTLYVGGTDITRDMGRGILPKLERVGIVCGMESAYKCPTELEKEYLDKMEYWSTKDKKS
ncbi:MAG: hypothetical protein WCG45_02145 [bacterium]